MHNAKILDFSARKQSDEADTKFLGLIDGHIATDPAAVKPIPSSLLNRIDRLREVVSKAKREHLLEG